MHRDGDPDTRESRTRGGCESATDQPIPRPVTHHADALAVARHAGTASGAAVGAAAARAWSRLPAALRWSLVLAGAVGIQLLRRPETLLRPEFFNEDGQVFYIGTYFGSPLETILRPYAGYLHLVPRLVALLSRLVPVADAPLVTNTAALLITAAVCAYIAGGRLSDAIPSAWLRWAIAALVVLLPNSHETLGSIAYAQWYLGMYLLVAAYATSPRTRGAEAIDLLTLGVASFTGPWGLLLAPLYAWQARPRPAIRQAGTVREPAPERLHWDGVRIRRALAVWLPSLVQLAYIIVTPAPSVGNGTATVEGAVGAFGSRFVDAPFLGAVWTSLLLQAGLPFALLAGLTVGIGGLIVVASRALTVPERVVALYVLGVAIMTTMVRERTILGGFLDPGVAERYVVVPGLVLAAAAVIALIRGRGAPRVAGMILVALLTFGIVGDFRIPPHPSLDWPQRSQCIGGTAPCTVPVQDPAIWTIHWPGSGGTYVQ